MKGVDFFAKYIKPHKFRGKGFLHPVPTGKVRDGLWAVHQLDVNFWLYEREGTAIAIDTGYKDIPVAEAAGLKGAPAFQDVAAVFLTHADFDHAGGLVGDHPLFSGLPVYLHRKEEAMLLGEAIRVKKGPIRAKNSIVYKGDYTLLDDGDVVEIGPIRVEILAMPGHTPGHAAYLVDDKILFSGDCIAVSGGVGYGFFDFFNLDTKQNLRSIAKLKERFGDRRPDLLCTGHSGYTADPAMFDALEQTAKGSRKHPFDPTAPKDPFASRP